mgnify:CR=1 FL=1
MKVLDCTFRDGGYYTDWQFSKDLVDKYLHVMKSLKVDYVELGLRQFPSSNFLGPFAYTSDTFLNELNLPKEIKYGVMINSSSIINKKTSPKDLINQLFSAKINSPISLVRVASHPHEIVKSKEIVLSLDRLGYEVGLNLMQVSTITEESLLEIISEISLWKVKPSVIYFADSLGSMSPMETTKILNAIKKIWNGDIGFHAHNNKGLALENVTACLKEGLNWVDSTITGMGRGAGNLSTEDLYINIKDASHKSLNSLYLLATNDFGSLKRKYEYGPNLLYRLAANHSIHPTFIQTLLADKGINESTHISILENLKNLDMPNRFSSEDYQNCLSIAHNENTEDSKFGNISKLYTGKDFLIIGGGDSIKDNKSIIRAFESQKNLISISSTIKSEDAFSSQLLCATSSNVLISHKKEIKNFRGKIIAPKHLLSSNSRIFMNKKNILHYGHFYSVQSEYHKNYFSTSSLLSGGYAIAAAISMGANKIYLIGFDGYKSRDKRFLKMSEILQFFIKMHGKDRIISLNHTSYPLSTESLYAHLDRPIK